MRSLLICSILAGCAKWESAPTDAQADAQFAGNPPARGACALEALPRAVELDAVLVGQPSESRLVLENVGDESISALTLGVEGSDGLSVVPNDTGPIAPGGTAEVVVQMNSLEPMEVAGALHVQYECAEVRGGSIEVPVAGTVLPTCASIEPLVLDFVTMPGVVEALSGYVWGCSWRRIRVQSATIDGPDADLFRFIDDEPFPVELGDPDVEQTYPFRFPVEFTAEVEGLYTARLQLTTDDPLEPVFEVPLQGRATIPPCAVAVATPSSYRVPPLSVVVLDGSASYGGSLFGRPWGYEWVVLERPEGSLSQPLESINASDPTSGVQDDPNTPMAGFFTDLVGRYVVELRVGDVLGREADECPDAAFAVEIIVEDPPN